MDGKPTVTFSHPGARWTFLGLAVVMGGGLLTTVQAANVFGWAVLGLGCAAVACGFFLIWRVSIEPSTLALDALRFVRLVVVTFAATFLGVGAVASANDKWGAAAAIPAAVLALYLGGRLITWAARKPRR